ncbi:MAG: hypothetical protein J0H50_13425 [Xanthomonadales bacterium]|nr:hypothetical protein [Xanthomonadales bacterium]
MSGKARSGVREVRASWPGEGTTTWLLALAVQHGGHLATFDRRLVTNAVHGGDAARHVIE